MLMAICKCRYQSVKTLMLPSLEVESLFTHEDTTTKCKQTPNVVDTPPDLFTPYLQILQISLEHLIGLSANPRTHLWILVCKVSFQSAGFKFHWRQ